MSGGGAHHDRPRLLLRFVLRRLTFFGGLAPHANRISAMIVEAALTSNAATSWYVRMLAARPNALRQAAAAWRRRRAPGASTPSVLAAPSRWTTPSLFVYATEDLNGVTPYDIDPSQVTPSAYESNGAYYLKLTVDGAEYVACGPLESGTDEGFTRHTGEYFDESGQECVEVLNPSAPPSPPPPSPSPPPPSPSPPPPSPPPSPSPPPVGYWSGFNPYNTDGVDCADWCKDGSASWTVSDCLEASTEGHFPIWNVINSRGAWECSTTSDGSFTPVKCNTFKFCAECDACYCEGGNSTLSPNPGAFGPNLGGQSCYATWSANNPSGARIAAASSVVIDWIRPHRNRRLPPHRSCGPLVRLPPSARARRDAVRVGRRLRLLVLRDAARTESHLCVLLSVGRGTWLLGVQQD